MSAVSVRVDRGGIPLGAVLGVAGAFACLAVGVLHLDHLPFHVCLFKILTGRPCMTCGTTRVLGRLFAMDLPGALAMNPLAAVVILALVPWAALDFMLLAQGKTFSLQVSSGAARLLRILVPVLVVANWAYLVAAGR